MRESKKDCFGYEKVRNTCKVLDHLYCKEEDCKFYKTKEQFEKERKLYGGVKKW